MKKGTLIREEIWEQLPEEAQNVLRKNLYLVIIPNEKIKMIEVDPEVLGYECKRE